MSTVNQKLSNPKRISIEVPLGTNLGQLLFLLCINDLAKCLHSTSAELFADDTNFSSHGSTSIDLETKLNADLHQVHKRLIANKLTLNKDRIYNYWIQKTTRKNL